MNASWVVYGTSLAVGGLVLFGALRAFWRRSDAEHGPEFGPPPPDLRILGRTRIGVGRSLVIVDVDGRRLLLGSTSHHWTALADLGTARTPDTADADGTIELELARAMEAARQRRGGRRS
jgi:flagellar biogenesis protein FliO